MREICELCSFHEATGYFKILDSHILDEYERKIWLCRWCLEDLKSLDVRIQKIAPSYEATPELSLET